MVEQLSPQGYERTKAKLTNLEAQAGGDRTTRRFAGRTPPRGVPLVPRNDATVPTRNQGLQGAGGKNSSDKVATSMPKKQKTLSSPLAPG